MAELPISLWKRVTGYAGFSLFALVAAFFLTFPYDALKDRIRTEADTAGYFVKIGSLGPGFFAVRASDVQLSKKLTGAPDEKPPEALHLDSVTIGPSLFPPGVSISVKAFGGSMSVKAGGITSASMKIVAEDLDLAKGNVKGFTGIDFAGKVDFELALSMPKVSVGGGPSEPDLGAATGTIFLETKNLAINGGTATMTIPTFGPEPTPLDLPKIVVGDLSAKLKFDKGAGTIEDFKSKSADLESSITGTVKLAKRVEYVEPNVELRFKPDPEFQKRLGLIGSALSMVGSDPKDPAWRLGHLTGFLGRPTFR